MTPAGTSTTKEIVCFLFIAPVFLFGVFFAFPNTADALTCPTYLALSWYRCPPSNPPVPGDCTYFSSTECISNACYYSLGSETCSNDSQSCTGTGQEWSETYYTCKVASEGGGCRTNTRGGDCALNSWFDVSPSTTQWVSSGDCTEKQQKQQEYIPGTCTGNGACDSTPSGSTQWVDTNSTRNKTDGTSCTSVANACGSTSGMCGNGSCASPATPYTVGAACNRNACGGTGAITDACTGACSATAPTVYTVDAACNRNACGGTGTITDACTGACSATAPTPCPPPPSDTTAPNNVTNLSSTSHTTSTWSSDSTVDVSWTAATDNTGGSGLDGYSVLWNTTSNTVETTPTKDIEETVTTQTSSALVNGNSHYFHIRSVDNAGIWASGAVHLGPFYIDTTGPTTSFTNPSASSWQDANFTVSVSDADTGGSGLSTCYYGVDSDDGDSTTNNETVPLTTTRTCNSVPQITVGPTGNCRNTGSDKCKVYLYSTDGTGLTSAFAVRTFSIGFLTYPSNVWQRLWYTVSGSEPNFSLNTFLGEDTIADINKDWVGGELCASSVCGGTADSRKNTIGFKASRTLTGLTPGAYTISVGADDGIKLFVNDGSNLLPASAWDSNHSWDDNRHTVFVELGSTAKIEIHYRENTGDAKITFAYNLGVVPDSGPICSNRPESCPSGTVCGTPTPYYPPCDFYAAGGICYYNSSTAGCSTGNWYSSAYYTCSYNSMCTLQSWQSCTSLGCVEGISPTVTINTTSDHWYKDNTQLVVDADATDNVALQSIKYQIDSYTADQSGTAATSNGSSALAVSGTSSLTADWKIKSSDTDVLPDSWDDLSEGLHTIYVKAIDTSGNCTGCLESTKKFFTIKKDTLLPTSEPIIAKPPASGYRASDNTYWFKVGDYSITIIDKDDTTPGVGKYSDLDISSCYYRIKDLGTGIQTLLTLRACNLEIPLKVDVGLHCVTEGENKCQLELWSFDKAGNQRIATKHLNIDRTAPSAK